MAGSKEIRTKIKSVQNTRKITKAMEMVAASKMRKAQERMRHARPYGDKIRTIASHLAHANTEYRHPFLVKREGAKKVGLIVVTSDKGLCGGLNTNALRLALNKLKEWLGEGLAARPNWDYLYEPEAKVVLDQLLTRYVEQIIYQSVAENIASEQSARMVAMKAASDNASSVIDDLTLVYNKSRQAAITKELSEIVSGAAAV